MLKITPKMFFDRSTVTRAVDKATRGVLSKAGAFVRTRARSLIRPRQRSARPGEPPTSHTGLLRRFIYFGFEARKKNVVIGPTPLNTSGGNQYGPKTVPEILEHSGTVTAMHRGKRVIRRYAGNPFMGPALEAEADNFPKLWRNSVRR